MNIAELFAPKPLDCYEHLTDAGSVQLYLTQSEKAVALKVHDHGVEVLNEEEKCILYSLIGKLKDVIHP